jgi:hypothetical protein
MAWNGATRRRGSDGAAEKEAAALRLSSDMAEWECSTTTSSLSLSLSPPPVSVPGASPLEIRYGGDLIHLPATWQLKKYSSCVCVRQEALRSSWPSPDLTLD